MTYPKSPQLIQKFGNQQLFLLLYARMFLSVHVTWKNNEPLTYLRVWQGLNCLNLNTGRNREEKNTLRIRTFAMAQSHGRPTLGLRTVLPRRLNTKRPIKPELAKPLTRFTTKHPSNRELVSNLRISPKRANYSHSFKQLRA